MSKRKAQPWNAENMPWIAAATAKSERTYLDRTEAELGNHYTRALARTYVDALDDCALFWLGRTAEAVAQDLATAKKALPDLTFDDLQRASDLPDTGLMLWPKPVAYRPWRNEDDRLLRGEPDRVSIDGVLWQRDRNTLNSFLLSRMLEQRTAGRVSLLRPEPCPMLVAGLDSWPTDADMLAQDKSTLDIPAEDAAEQEEVFGNVEQIGLTITRFITAAWAMLGQERMVQRKGVTIPDRKSGEPRPVTIYDSTLPAGAGGAGRPAEGSAAERVATRRWFVRAHFRHQPHGPNNSLRKLIVVGLHTAGHPDAPEPTGEPGPRVAAVYGEATKPRLPRNGGGT